MDPNPNDPYEWRTPAMVEAVTKHMSQPCELDSCIWHAHKPEQVAW